MPRTKAETKKSILRDEKGLLKNVEHKFKENGMVDWKAMIPLKYIVPNSGIFKARGEEAPETAEGLPEEETLILLDGFKEVARLRGILSKDDRIVISQEDRAAVECKVIFTPNFESEFEPFHYSGCASATSQNVTSYLGRMYLEAIAENRAFVRAVRNALGIEVLGFDEVSSSFEPDVKNSNTEVGLMGSGTSPHKLLEDMIRSKPGIKDFNGLKSKLTSYIAENGDWKGISLEMVNAWQSFTDIEAKVVWTLFKEFNEKEKK